MGWRDNLGMEWRVVDTGGYGVDSEAMGGKVKGQHHNSTAYRYPRACSPLKLCTQLP